MSAQTSSSCDGTDLQGSHTALVHPGSGGGGGGRGSSSFDDEGGGAGAGGGSTGDLGEGPGPGGHHPMVLEGEEEERGPLKNRAEFLLLLVAAAAGTRSLVQFPALAMRHGGGAFTFVYLVLMGLLGLPLLYMEMALGQYARGGPASAWKITPLSRGVTYSMLVVTTLLMIYGNTYTAWSLFYLFSSFSPSLPWQSAHTDWGAINNTLHHIHTLVLASGSGGGGSGATPAPPPPRPSPSRQSSSYHRHPLHNLNVSTTTSTLHALLRAVVGGGSGANGSGQAPNQSVTGLLERYHGTYYAQRYFYDEVLGVSEGLDQPGSIQVYLCLCLLLAWILTTLTVAWGPRSMGKVAYCTGLLPLLLLLPLLGATCSLPGSVLGLRAFLTPRWPELAKIQVWWDGAKLVLNGFACGTGVTISLSAWAHFHSQCFRNSVVITVLTVMGTLLGGCMLFAGLGSQLLFDMTDLRYLHYSAVDLAYSLFPSVAARLPAPWVWLVTWYGSLVVGGLGLQSAMLHAVYDSVLSLACLQRRKSRIVLLLLLALLLFVMSLATVTQGGLYVVQFLEHYVYVLSVPAVCLAEVLCLMWLYGVQRLANRLSDMTASSETFLWKWMWKFLCPSLLAGIIIISFTATPFPATQSASLATTLASLVDALTASLSTHSSSSSSSSSSSLSTASGAVTVSPRPEPRWTEGVGLFLTCLPLLPALFSGLYLFCIASGSCKQRLKSLGVTPRDWGPRHLEHEPQLELPDYVICSPDVYRPANALALLTANLYLPNLSAFLTLDHEAREDQGEMGGGYLSDLMTVSSSEEEDGSGGGGEEENHSRGNWGGRFEFVFTCLGYVVGLGNIWRFPYLVYRNGGGAFFIAYLVMLVCCGLPLVFMELAFGQFASLGPITVWKAAPIFKGVGYSMVLISALVSIYYNMVTAWAFHYLFTSLTARLPWGFCNNTWNTAQCTINKYAADNCSAVNQSMLLWPAVKNLTTCHPVLSNCSAYEGDLVGQCVSTLKDLVGEESVASYHSVGANYTSSSEEYFYRSVLDVSSGLGRLGSIKWQMALCLLLCWVITFICLLKGIKTAGKVSYVVVLIPYIAVLVLLIRGVSMTGSSQGIHFYTTPRWELLRQPRMWGDAAAQVFFSLSVCWGGLTTLASYNRFHNNVYRDALLVCIGDTLMSVMSGFAVFAMVGVLSEKLGASVQDVIQSDVGMTFIVYPAALLSFPVPSLWSILFFLMLVTMGLGTTFCTIETLITALIDEQPSFKKKRVLMLLLVCLASFLLGLPLASQGGLYLLQLMDEYLCSFPLLVTGIMMCCGIAWLYGLRQFCRDIQHMIRAKVGLWWRVVWSGVCPVVILFIIISSAIGYQTLGQQFDMVKYPWWSEALGFFIVVLCVLPIFLWPLGKIVRGQGPLVKRIQVLCRPTPDWGPALEKNSHFVEYFPAVQTNLLAVELDHPPLNTITGDKHAVNFDLWDQTDSGAAWSEKEGAERVDFTTVGVRVPSQSHPSLLPVTSLSQQLPTGARVKVSKPLDMRQKAILNHAYSNPQCHLSSGSIEKLTQGTRLNSSSDGALNDVVVTPRGRGIKPVMKDASTQTVVSCFEKMKRQTSEPIGRATTPPTPASTLPRSMSWRQEGEPAVIEVEVTRF